MGALLALASSLAYGIADFAGGLLSRRAHFGVVALVGQLAGFVVALAVAPWVPSSVTGADLAWGALSGVGTGLGMLFLYRGLSRGDMSVVVPVSAVGGVALPVLVGVVLLGNRPTPLVWVGIVVALPAIWLVSRTGTATGAAGDGVVAGVGIAVQYLALAQIGPEAGIWAVVVGRVTAALAIVPAVRDRRLPVATGLGAAGCGAAAAFALGCYLLATRHELVVIAVVLSSLYPAIPVLLGVTVLRERLARWQTVGLAGAAVAVGLLVFG